ncbi:MAG: phenylacetate--CoA ligase family protein, partial [Ramlibacter sp.]|nr:phenylacetate--CoA ligase family protein [Ramlibacter sp.]
MNDFFDALESREPARRERDLMAALPGLVAHAQTRAPAFARILNDVDAAAITSREALATLPVTRKHELFEQQRASDRTDVFGGFAALRRGPQMQRVFASPGPIYEPEGKDAD